MSDGKGFIVVFVVFHVYWCACRGR
jgi:hypothetical protein